MITCPYCQAENRSGAKFCKNCASALPETVTATKSINPENSPTTIRLEKVTKKISNELDADTEQISIPIPFSQRPPGSIFNNNYIYQELIFSNDQQNQYTVTSTNDPEFDRILVCPNQSCGALFPPTENETETYCTDCGTMLEPYTGTLTITETLRPVPAQIVLIVDKYLSHGSVRAPLEIFAENVSGSLRYCLVSVPVEPLDCTPTVSQALRWGVELSLGLDYLHDNGITFRGNIDSTCFGLVGERMVWFNFLNANVEPEGYISDRGLDTQALAEFIYLCLTGKTQYEADSDLPSIINQAFFEALSSSRPKDGQELSELFETALSKSIVNEVVDYQVGRRTHVGMVRSLNEDSLLTLELSRIQQSVNYPIGIFVVADGMGGHSGGELASGTIVSNISKNAIQELFQENVLLDKNHDRMKWLQESVEKVNRDVYELRESSGTDMGSTMVAALLENAKAYIAHVGDSRAYLINKNGISQLTTDHSLVERLIASNQITREEARTHPQRNVIYRTIGDKLKVDVNVQEIDLKVDDILLLCSDGLSGMVTDQAMFDIVQNASCPQNACEQLIQAANANGGDDNITVVIIKIIRIGDSH
jgi:PPM family protein phosphatase